jgi:hypothetical protein
VSPRDYSSVYGGYYACSARPLPPFRYSSPLQQASKQASRILAQPGCRTYLPTYLPTYLASFVIDPESFFEKAVLCYALAIDPSPLH